MTQITFLKQAILQVSHTVSTGEFSRHRTFLSVQFSDFLCRVLDGRSDKDSCEEDKESSPRMQKDYFRIRMYLFRGINREGDAGRAHVPGMEIKSSSLRVSI